ncbi:MAG: asparagine synthetase B [Anaerolineales bacterium]|nr:asparagine synthetase B [Anaerolineales bacterium]
MSGIGGVVYFDGHPAEPADLAGFSARLSQRGPDGGGLWLAGPVALAQHALWTTPESLAERGPFTSPDGALVIAADARLDNRAELCRALDLRDAGQPDSALILAAYARWGEAAPERLLGDFAFAVWDAREQRLFCARDAMGVRPFFYYQSARCLAWASDLKALLALPGVPCRVNELRLADFLTGGHDLASTFYADIMRLPPAHTLSVSAHGEQPARLRRYWDLAAPRDTRLPSDAAYAEAFRELLTASVRARVRSAFPVGSMLSGGLDSTSVVCLARGLLDSRTTGGRLHTFSLLFDAVPASDERGYMAPTVAAGGLEHHTILADEVTPLSDLETLLDIAGEPYHHMGLPLQWLADAAAQQAGVRVLLDGNYGDAVVTHGNMRLAELAHHGQWRALAREVAGLTTGWRRRTRGAFYLAWLAAFKPLLPKFGRQAWRGLRRWRDPQRPAWAFQSIIAPAFAQRMTGQDALQASLHRREQRYRTTRAENQFSVGKMQVQPELYNRLAARCGLELRHPFLDRRLVEFCLGLPSEQRLRDGWARIVQRNAMAGILPEAVRWRRSKSSPIYSMGRALFTRDLPRLGEIVHAAGGLERWVDPAALQRDYDRLCRAAAEARYHQPADWRAMARLDRAVHLALWLDQLDQASNPLITGRALCSSPSHLTGM